MRGASARACAGIASVQLASAAAMHPRAKQLPTPRRQRARHRTLTPSAGVLDRLAMASAAPSLPKEVVYVVLATPLLSQPIVNPDVFHEPVTQLLREVLGNYIPAFAIVVSLWVVQRGLAPWLAARTAEGTARVLLHTLAAGLVAALASVLVLPIHRLATEPALELGVYLQRNVGFTCL